MVTKVHRFLSIRWILGSGLILIGALNLLFPDLFAARSNLLFQNQSENIWLIYALGVALTGAGLAIFTERQDEASAAIPGSLLLITLFAIAHFLILSLHLQDWWIDDAGITFAYSRSLAEGLGLVAQPWMPPEEGYSSSIWMLLLSLMGRLGADIPMAAKYLGISFSGACIVFCCWILERETRSPLALLVCGIGIACAPTVVWAVSGQEHALQALLLLIVVCCVYQFEHWRWPVAMVLSVFVLTRPEAPIIVIGVFLAAVFLTWRAGGPLINVADAAIALIPFLTFLALIAFRMVYFGDLLPNPFYAKSSAAGLTGIFNPLGGGWSYVLASLRDTGVIFILSMVFLIRARPLPSWIVVALAILAAHTYFVIWAKGDWMAQYRFLMPILPVALLIACLGLRNLTPYGNRAAFGAVAILFAVHTATLQLASFKESPTTPLSVVTQVGDNFRALADRLEINDPVLAHHDAGGIAYHRMIRLVDLGGLVNRTIAKNMNDKAFLSSYLLEEVQPDFFFGARNFAAASGFSDTEIFSRDYVPIEFTGLAYMQNDLVHMRRDKVTRAPGVEPLYDERGTLVGVSVDLGTQGQ